MHGQRQSHTGNPEPATICISLSKFCSPTVCASIEGHHKNRSRVKSLICTSCGNPEEAGAFCQTTSSVDSALPEPPETIAATDPVITVDLTAGDSGQAQSIRNGQGAEVILRGFAPGSVVTVTLNSTPRALASLTADTEGVAEGVVYAPLDLPSGQHTVQAYEIDPDGKTLELAQPLAVSPPLPWWWWPVIWIFAAALTAGAVIAALTLLRTRTKSR